MRIDKVKVSREVVEAIEICRGLNPAFIVREIASYYYGGRSCDLRTQNLAQLLLDSETELDQAVQVAFGYYVIEQTPQERLKEVYLDHLNLSNADFRYSKGFCEGIEFTLSTLNIKVSGVN